MEQGIPAYYKWLARHPVTNAIVLDPIPHAHRSRFEVIAAQPGMTGAAGIGTFEIPLADINGDDYAFAADDLAKIDYGYRLEAYQIGSPSGPDPAGVIGVPKFTGVVTKKPKDLGTASIAGVDSLYLLQRARMDKIVNKLGLSDAIFKYGLKAHTMVAGYDFNVDDLTGLTNNGGFTLTTDDGWGAVQPPSPSTGDGLLYTNTSWTNPNYFDCVLHAPWHVVCNNAASAVAQAHVIAAVTDANNMVMAGAQVRFVAANRYEVDAQIWQKVAGTWFIRTPRNVVFTQTNLTHASPQDLRAGIHLIGVQTSSTTYAWILRVNQFEVACRWDQTVTAGNPVGAVGIKSTKQGVAAAELAYSRGFIFLNKTNIFQEGTISAAAKQTGQNYSFSPNIDMLNDAITTEHFLMRKNPKAGTFQDSIDFAASPGTDLTASVTLEAGVNLAQSSIEANAEPLSTAVIMTHAPGPDNDGQTYWFNVPAIRKFGYLIDQANAPHASDTLAIRKRADQVLIYRATPDQSKRLDIVRTMDLQEQPGQNNPSGLSFRELDFVTAQSPLQGLNKQKVQVLSYICQEGSPLMQTIVDQWAVHTDAIPKLEELRNVVNAAAAGVGDRTGTYAGVVNDGKISFPYNPYKVRAWLNTITNITFAGANVKIPLDRVTAPGYDPSGSFDTTNSWLVAPVDGYYDVFAAVGASNQQVNANLFYSLAFSVNTLGNVVTQGNTYPLPAVVANAGSFGFTVQVSDRIWLYAGDKLFVSIGGGVASPPTLPLTTGSQYTYLTAELNSRA